MTLDLTLPRITSATDLLPKRKYLVRIDKSWEVMRPPAFKGGELDLIYTVWSEPMPYSESVDFENHEVYLLPE